MPLRWRTKLTDPWLELAPPRTAATVTARRVGADVPWAFFWARDHDGNCLLILRHGAASLPNGRLPLLQGVELRDSEDEDGLMRVLSLRLVDESQRDIFQQLCLDIVESTAGALSERDALNLALARTWRWHHLLRGGRDGRLSDQAQKGLIGELLVLERCLLRLMPPRAAVLSWRGPLDAPKDFEIGRLSIEAKARRGAATPFVDINSEYQLDRSAVDQLFLYVVALDSAPTAVMGSFTISDVARRIYDDVRLSDPDAGDVLAGRLTAAGLEWDDDYSDTRWTEGTGRIFHVRQGFPAITPEVTPLGLTRINYSLALKACEPYEVDVDTLMVAISEALRAG